MDFLANPINDPLLCLKDCECKGFLKELGFLFWFVCSTEDQVRGNGIKV